MPARPTTLLCLALVALATRADLPVQSAATQPSTVTLRLRDASPRAVADELAKQANVILPPAAPDLFEKGGLPKAVTVDVDRQPFWAALREVGRRARLEPFVPLDDPYPRFRLAASAGDAANAAGGFWDEPHAIAGPLLVFANDVHRTNTVEPGKTRKQDRVERELRLDLTAFVEPGLRVVAVSQEIALREAVDENGKSLKPPGDTGDAAGSLNGPQANAHQWNVSVDLDTPPTTGQRVAKLRGLVYLRVVTAHERVEFDDVTRLRGVTRTVAGAPFTLRSLKKQLDEYHLQFSLRRDRLSPTAWATLYQSAYQGQMQLYDAKGRLVAARATEQAGDYGNEKVDATIRFFREAGVTDPEAGEPHKLVWLAPTASRDLPVEFELTDLPIPQ